jgi:ribose transport system permease protein
MSGIDHDAIQGIEPPARRSAGSTLAHVARNISLGGLTGVVVALVGVCIYLWATEPVFMSWGNWENIIRSEAVVAVLAIGMTYVVLTGGIDLSIASTTAAAAIVLGVALESGWSSGASVVASIAVGLGLGLVNGILIGVAKIPFFVVTLGSLSVFQSAALLISKSGETRSLLGYGTFGWVSNVVNGTTGPFPTILLIVAGLYLIGAFVLKYTTFGRSVYMVGSNVDAARLTGIHVTGVLIAVYAISGLAAGVGAVIQGGRLSGAAPQADPTLMLTVVAAVLIGGAAFTGGEGNLLGTIIGVLFLGVIQNGLTLSNISTFWQGTVSGGILWAAVGIAVLRDYGWQARRARASRRRGASL